MTASAEIANVAKVQPDPSDALAALVERARSAMSGTAPVAGAESAEPFVGEAADGQVRAEVGADGRVRNLRIDPLLARRGLDEISGHVVAAVNAALDARPAAVDAAPLLAELKAVQEQSVVEMARISQAFSTALEQAMRK
jgi:DNA-binding protein YbaB